MASDVCDQNLDNGCICNINFESVTNSQIYVTLQHKMLTTGSSMHAPGFYRTTVHD